MKFSDQSLPVGQRIAARVEYAGAHFHGWQAQPHLAVETAQETLESALASVAGVPVPTTCAGRTDTGVHGFGQIVHFDDPVGRSAKAWVLGCNRHLSDAIRVHWVAPVNEQFHARYSALSRQYRYVILNTPVRSAALAGSVTWYRHPLDLAAMNGAATTLLGEQDFSAFRAAACQASSAHRCVHHCSVVREGDFVIIDIEANAFLYHMVRNIAGSLLNVGSGRQSVSWFESVLASGDRTQAAETAPPDGLYLVRVNYPPEFELPSVPDGPTIVTRAL